MKHKSVIAYVESRDLDEFCLAVDKLFKQILDESKGALKPQVLRLSQCNYKGFANLKVKKNDSEVIVQKYLETNYDIKLEVTSALGNRVVELVAYPKCYTL